MAIPCALLPYETFLVYGKVMMSCINIDVTENGVRNGTDITLLARV